MKTWTVYRHIFPNNKSYIGITSKENPYDRFGKNGCEYGHYVGKAIKKYGWENVKHEILETGLTQQEANIKEKYYIKYFNTQTPNGYNITSGGEGRSGYKRKPMPQEVRDKISKTKKGIKMSPRSDIWKKHISEGKLKSNYKHTPETLKKLSERKQGATISESTRLKISETVKRKKLYSNLLTEESRQHCKDKICIKIEQLDCNNNVIKTFESATDCAKYFNCSVSSISQIISGKRKNKYNIRRILNE